MIPTIGVETVGGRRSLASSSHCVERIDTIRVCRIEVLRSIEILSAETN
jgi:hypothetical protein